MKISLLLNCWNAPVVREDRELRLQDLAGSIIIKCNLSCIVESFIAVKAGT